MTYEEYMTKAFEIFRYVLYLTDEKAKVQRFVSGFPLSFRDQIEYEDPRSLEEVIGKLINEKFIPFMFMCKCSSVYMDFDG